MIQKLTCFFLLFTKISTTFQQQSIMSRQPTCRCTLNVCFPTDHYKRQLLFNLIEFNKKKPIKINNKNKTIKVLILIMHEFKCKTRC